MNWVQPKFTDFALPPSKKFKFDRKPRSDSLGTSKTSNIHAAPIWKPKVRSDLVVNKKKIEEVENWLLKVKRKGQSSILLLTGPSGCGKLTTLKILCSEMKINLIEWLPQVSRKYDPENRESYQSLVSIFEDFISRATRYSNVLNSMSSRLIVIKDIPHPYIMDPNSFHVLLDRYSKIPEVYLAFILTDVSIIRSLFPDSVKSCAKVDSLAFNPITIKGVKDTLKRIFPTCTTHVDTVTASCNGDLRNAITTYEFVSKNGALASRTPDAAKSSEKSDFLDIFRGLGRVVYCKRESDGKLVHDPVEVGENFVSSPGLFLGMLHENYPNTYSSVHDIAKASDTLSTAEILLNDFVDSQSSKSISLIVASYGVMTSNTNPVKKFLQMSKARKFSNSLAEFRSRFSDTNVLLDVTSYGRAIPSYSQENQDMLSQIKPLK